MEPRQSQSEPTEEIQSTQGGREPEWALPEPSEPRRPPEEGTARSEVPSQTTEEQEEKLSKQEFLTPEQQLVEADKRHRKRLAALARDHIVKFRVERQRMAQGWLKEYSMHAALAKLCKLGLGTLRAEYIYKYNRMLDPEKQPDCDFFINLSPELEDELDFEEEPFNLYEYDQYFEWDEAEYMRLRFIAARHYASQGHWDDAYAYVLRSRTDDIPQHEDTYSRNAQAWHYTNARINEWIQDAEQALEFRDRQMAQWSLYRPLGDSLIPPGQVA